MFAASKTDGSAVAPDAQFNYVTMLLHGDGTNGAQNNTFLDSSTNNFTITRNGNTTQGSFSPYGSNWSNYFSGSNNLNLDNNTALQMSTGNFTIEFWLNFSGLSNYQTIFSKGYTSASGGLLIQTNTGTGTLLVYAAGSVVITASSASTVGTWNHYALVRNSGTLTLYLNGTSVGSASNSTDFNNTGDLNISFGGGYYFYGNMSNLRVVKGTAVYTGSFTPSTTPLTAITNTQLLTCQSNRFVDNSTNALTINSTGSPSVQRFNPFGTSTAYSTSVIGGSGYFDGSGDYLQCAYNSAFALGSSDFTIEAWVNTTDTTSSYPSIIGRWQSAGNACWDFRPRSTDIGNFFVFVYTTNGTTPLSVNSNTVINDGAWHHLVAVRSGNNFALFVDGVRKATASFTGITIFNSTSAPLYVGYDPYGSTYYTGYQSNTRLVNGTAVYDPTQTTLTVPTAPLTAVTNTAFLANFTNGAIFDNAMMNDLETVGNAQISTSVKKYGTGSLAFDGTGDWLRLLTTPNITLGSGNFTFEGWLYLNTVSGAQIIFDQRPASTQGVYPVLYMDGATMTWYINGTARITSSSLSASTWYHFAISRSSGSTKLFINGTQSGSTYTDANNYLASRSYLGISAVDETGGLNGYIDDLRITNGYARYTATFTPPTSAFSDTGPY